MWVSSYRSSRGGAAAPPPPSGYDLPTVIAAVRAADSEFTDTSDPFAPAGLALPAAPTGLTPVTAASLAALRAHLVSPNGKFITYTGSDVTESAGQILFAMPPDATDVRIDFQRRICNISGDIHPFTTHWSNRRIRIENLVTNAVPEVQGRDIYLSYIDGVGGNAWAEQVANGSGEGFRGHRIVIDRCKFYGFNGLFFTGAVQGAEFEASISGTTMTVTLVYRGSVNRNATVFRFSGAVAKGTKIVDQLTGTAGGVGTYQLRSAQTVSGAFTTTQERSTNLIAANSDLECITAYNGPPPGRIENPVRFNGVNMGLVVDCRLSCDGKYTGRVHPDFGYVFGNGKVGFVRTQAEKYGINCAQLGGVTPGTELIVMDAVKVYREVESTWSFDRLMGINATAVSGDGVTVTYDCEGDNGHGLVDGERVTTQGWTPSAFNQTNVMVNVVSPTRFQYMAIGAMGSASGGFAISQKDGIVLMRQRNCEVFSAPAIGTNGVGLLPGGSGSPPSDWPTANNTTNAAAAGNFVRTQVAPPPWSRQ